MVISVYPRTYGEHSSNTKIKLIYRGLSPYLRGTLQQPTPAASSMRFIPVLTGNTERQLK
ncbi:conserved hypothetical protein [Xenorhabdus nematophila str. Websteri]|nr:conserved hypothetical protein [Xenorhabdus nematophila str. Websteri]